MMELRRDMKIVKVTVEDLHELEWIEGTDLSNLPKAKITFIGELVFENEKYIVIRNSRFHDNPYNLPLKNVGVKLPRSIILEIEEVGEPEPKEETKPTEPIPTPEKPTKYKKHRFPQEEDVLKALGNDALNIKQTVQRIYPDMKTFGGFYYTKVKNILEDLTDRNILNKERLPYPSGKAVFAYSVKEEKPIEEDKPETSKPTDETKLKEKIMEKIKEGNRTNISIYNAMYGHDPPIPRDEQYEEIRHMLMELKNEEKVNLVYNNYFTNEEKMDHKKYKKSSKKDEAEELEDVSEEPEEKKKTGRPPIDMEKVKKDILKILADGSVRTKVITDTIGHSRWKVIGPALNELEGEGEIVKDGYMWKLKGTEEHEETPKIKNAGLTAEFKKVGGDSEETPKRPEGDQEDTPEGSPEKPEDDQEEAEREIPEEQEKPEEERFNFINQPKGKQEEEPDEGHSQPHEEHNILRTIEKHEPVSTGMISIETGMEIDKLTEILNKLEKDGRIKASETKGKIYYSVIK